MVDAGFGPAVTWGISGVPMQSADASAAPANVTDAPSAGQKLVLVDLIISSDTDLTFTFTEETSGTVIYKQYVAANTTLNLATRGKRKLATADKKLQVQTNGAGNISVLASYYSEA